MTTTSPDKVTFVLPPHHNWLKGLRGSSLILEYLLDKEFGKDVGNNRDTQDRLNAEKIIKAQRIMEQVRAKKLKEKNDLPDPPDKKRT